MNPDPAHPVFFNSDCIAGAREHLPDGSVDLIVTDPPYGIEGDALDRHYNRKESFVLDGYVEVDQREYGQFSRTWIREAERVLRPGGAIYLFSGYSNLRDVLNALADTSLVEVNHIVWKYNFGVFTTRKYVSSHYHILYYEKPGGTRTFERFARYGESVKDARGGSVQYRDMEDVWTINREYKPGAVKNRNELPRALVSKILQYSSRPGDVVADFFLGSFAVAKVAKAMGRAAVGFEVNPTAFTHHEEEVAGIEVGEMLDSLPTGDDDRPRRRGQPWGPAELDRLLARYLELREAGMTKRAAIDRLAGEFERGRFAILNALKRRSPSRRVRAGV